MTGPKPLPADGLRVGDRVRLTPPGAEASSPGVVDVVLTRGAFGSGEHETTASCLEALVELTPCGEDVLDVGSGTGVLAIAAVLLGASRGVCVDPEPGAVATARRNGILNGIDGRLWHVQGTLAALSEEARFPLVVANLYGDLVLAQADRLASASAPGGTLLLSGIAWEYVWDVRRRFELAGFSSRRTRMLETFATLVLDRV